MRIGYVQLKIAESACGCKGCPRRGRELVDLDIDGRVRVVVSPKPSKFLVVSWRIS